MLLNIGRSSDFNTFLKYSAKSGTWTIRHPGGGDQKLDQPTFVADLESIRTGWFLFREGRLGHWDWIRRR